MFQHILVPLDGSHLAEKALPAAAEIAAKFDSKITLLRIVPPPFVYIEAPSVTYADVLANLSDHARLEAENYLETQQGSLRQQGYKVNIKLIEGTPVADRILDVIEGMNYDAVIMSTHGRGGLGRWVFGSVADKILQNAGIPIILIRSQNDDD